MKQGTRTVIESIVKFAVGAALRYWLNRSKLAPIIADHVMVSTPLNQWKRMLEGVHLQKNNISPYDGTLFHETPLNLFVFSFLLEHIPLYIPYIFILLDLVTGAILAQTTCQFVINLMEREQIELKASSTKLNESSLISLKDTKALINVVTTIYMLNPFSIISCVGQTTTVTSNLILAMALYSTVSGHWLISSFFFALSSYQTLYPVSLLLPAAMYIAQLDRRSAYGKATVFFVFSKILIFFSVFVAYFLYVSARYMQGDLSFLESVYGCILSAPDYRPNVGLFWYFFTEMFDHFRSFFICVFQINVFVYLIPMCIRFRNDPGFVLFIQLGLITLFKSYPSVGDVAFYFALLPCWGHLYRHLKQTFAIGCAIVASTVLAPILYHLWIYAGSGNANFYFGVTLVFNSAQIFLLTDLMFAAIRREFVLENGEPSPDSPIKLKLN